MIQEELLDVILEFERALAQRRKPILHVSTLSCAFFTSSSRSFNHPSATAFVRTSSALRGKNDAEQHAFVRAFLRGSADMSATIRRDHIVDPVIGNRRPFAVYLDLVMVADHAALRGATVHEITAGAFAVVSVQL